MTATCADSTTGLSAKGLDISLAALQRQDPYINNIVDLASQVALYTFNNRTNEWEKTEIEGTLFVYTRLASPRHGFTIMNRLRMENLTEPITKDLDFQLQDPFLLYRNARLVIHGIWFYDKQDCQRIAQKMRALTQQEQALAQSQGGWLSPGGEGGGGGGKVVDILQMLTKARSEYDKSSSEPKEIGGSSVLYGNPNLIKPIPVKPTTQDSEGGQPLTLATLFGPQQQQQRQPLSGDRLAVVRTLTYDGPPGARGRPQHCPAIQKLVLGRVGAGGVLQVEAPERRLCENGLPLEHLHQQQQHLHQLQQQHLQLQQQHLQRFLQQQHLHSMPHDPIQRLFQKQPAPLLPHCCPSAPPHPPSRPLFYAAASESHAGSQPSPAAAVVSPHELLQKLQLVQQEQRLAPRDAPQHCPGLAPRFPATAPSTAAPTALGSSHKPGLQFQVLSPRRIPATVAPTMLLSPSVFSQSKPSPAGALSRPLSLQEDVPMPSRSQLQAALLHLVQTDASFLDSIYDAYVGRIAKETST